MRPSIERVQDTLDDPGKPDRVRQGLGALLSNLGNEEHFEDPHLERYREKLRGSVSAVVDAPEEHLGPVLDEARDSVRMFWVAVRITLGWRHPDQATPEEEGGRR